MTDTTTMAKWTESPFTTHDHRGDIIQHRMIVREYGGVGVDIAHEVRSTDYHGCPDEWTEVDVLEVRDHGTLRTRNEQEWWA